MNRIYISGPMTGLPYLNFPAFYNEAARLRALGYDVINPAEINQNKNIAWHDALRNDLKSATPLRCLKAGRTRMAHIWKCTSHTASASPSLSPKTSRSHVMIADSAHYVVDIETLGVRDDAIIASIGIVRCCNGVQAGCFYAVISTEQRGRSFDDATVAWWGDAARDQARSEYTPEDEIAKEYMLTLGEVLCGVEKFINTSTDAPIWGNGADFDNRILGHAYRQHGMQWPYWRNACLRTLRNLVGSERYQPTTERIKHIAINDALTEAEELLYLLSRIRVMEEK